MGSAFNSDRLTRAATRARAEHGRRFLGSRFEIEIRTLKGTRIAPVAAHGFQVMMAFEGACRFRIAGEKGSLRQAEWLLANPGESVILDVPPHTSARLVKVIVDGRKLYELAGELRILGNGNQLRFTRHTARESLLPSIAETIWSEMEQRHPGKALMLASAVDQLCVHLLRQFVAASRSTQLELSRVGPVDRRIRRAVELMHLRYQEDLSLRTLASEAFLSPFHFSRLFKRLTGMSPHAYLAALRIERAKELLANYELPIVSVGERVGYENHSHFTRIFRTSVGVTPKVFRDSLVL